MEARIAGVHQVCEGCLHREIQLCGEPHHAADNNHLATFSVAGRGQLGPDLIVNGGFAEPRGQPGRWSERGHDGRTAAARNGDAATLDGRTRSLSTVV